MRKLAQVFIICQLLNCKPEEITKHSKNIYSWRGIMYEVTGSKSTTVSKDHYTLLEYKNRIWAIRELGKQSKQYVKKISS